MSAGRAEMRSRACAARQPVHMGVLSVSVSGPCPTYLHI